MRYRVASALVVVVLALVVAPLTAQASPRSQTLDEQIEYIAHQVVGQSATGMTVAVVDGSQTEILQAFGHADEKQERRLSVDSRMPVASVSKVVTALTALTLHQQGALDLDAPIEQVSHVAMRDERAPADRAPLSGRHLLTHHAGLAESTVLPPPAGSDDLQRPLSDWLQRHPPVLGYPAVGMHYSPLVAYTVLGAAIENASGTSFDDAARSTVLGPVGASSATFRDDHDPADAAIVTPTENGFQAAPWPDAAEAPAASLRWSARDAAALLSALMTRKGSLPAQVVEQARTVSVRPHHGGGGHTQVFFENTRRGVKVLEHAGANGLAWLTLIPEADVGVFVAVNSHDEAATEATEAVIEAVIDWTVETERAHPALENPWPAIIPPWLPQSRPAIPTGAFQERLFQDRGPEKALRSLLSQVVVTADEDDLLMNGRRLSPAGDGRWCDPAGCVAGRVTKSGLTVFERGDRGMLEQTLTPASIRDDQRAVVAALSAWAVAVSAVAIGALLRLLRLLRGHRIAPLLAPKLAIAWAAASSITLAAVFAIPLGPLLLNASSSTPPAATWALTGLTTLSAVLAIGWAITAVRRHNAVSRRYLMTAATCAVLTIPANIYLLEWGFIPHL